MCSFDANYADWEEVFTSLSISRAILSLGTGFPLKNSKTNIRIDIFWSRCHRCRVSRFDYSSVEGYGCKISRDIVSGRTHRNCIAKNDRADGFMEKSLSLGVPLFNFLRIRSSSRCYYHWHGSSLFFDHCLLQKTVGKSLILRWQMVSNNMKLLLNKYHEKGKLKGKTSYVI